MAVDWAGLALAILLVELTPGPNMAWLAALAMGRGRAAGMAATAGIALGLFLNAIVAGAGAAALVASRPELWQALRAAGFVFMLWLAWDSWRDPRSERSGDSARAGWAGPMLSGFVVNLLNPKALLFYILLVPRFAGARTGEWQMILTVGALSVGIATFVHIIIILGGSSIGSWLADAGRSRPMRRLLAVSLIGVAIWFLVGVRPPA